MRCFVSKATNPWISPLDSSNQPAFVSSLCVQPLCPPVPPQGQLGSCGVALSRCSLSRRIWTLNWAPALGPPEPVDGTLDERRWTLDEGSEKRKENDRVEHGDVLSGCTETFNTSHAHTCTCIEGESLDGRSYYSSVLQTGASCWHLVWRSQANIGFRWCPHKSSATQRYIQS